MNGHQTRAERMRQPLASDVIAATAEQHGVCVRPFTMEVGDLDTGELRYVPVPCGSTVESQCGPCARKARALRMVQCREGWHLAEEPDFTPDQPTADQTALLELRADLVAAYRQAADGRGRGDELRDEIRSVDAELRQLGMRGRLPVAGRADEGGSEAVDEAAAGRAEAASAAGGEAHRRAGVRRPVPAVDVRHAHLRHLRAGARRRHARSTRRRYDYRRAARDAVHFAALVDRCWQNLRRCVGWDVQYFATVEPQKRGRAAPARRDPRLDPARGAAGRSPPRPTTRCGGRRTTSSSTAATSCRCGTTAGSSTRTPANR